MTQQMTQPTQQYGGQEPIGQQRGGMSSTQTGTGQQFGQPTGGQQPGQMGQQSHGQSQQFMGGQQGQQWGQQPGEGMDSKLEVAISDEMRVALHDFVQAATACEWCAEQCIGKGPQMAECVRLCRDVGDLASLNVQFLSRDSVFGPELAETFAIAAEACARECAQHRESHCQECAEVLDRAARSTWKMLESFGDGQMQNVQGTQTSGAQTAGQF